MSFASLVDIVMPGQLRALVFGVLDPDEHSVRQIDVRRA